MDTDDKRLVLAEHLDRFRGWSYETLVTQIDRTRQAHDCLETCGGVFEDGTEYHMEFNVFWDDQCGGDVRVCGDITTLPKRALFGFLPLCVPDATDSFIMRSDGSFVGE
jgi:hypothetical protein